MANKLSKDSIARLHLALASDTAGFEIQRILEASGSGGAGANLSLSNLAPTSISQDLLPNGSGNYQLGDPANVWDALYVYSPIIQAQNNSGTVELAVQNATASYRLHLPLAQGSAGQTLINNGSGFLSWAAGGSGASQALDNLTPTSINQHLLPQNGMHLGSNGAKWDIVFANNLISRWLYGPIGGGPDTLLLGTDLVYGEPHPGVLKTLDATTSQPLNISTGNSSAGTSGDINISTGSAPSQRGLLTLGGVNVRIMPDQHALLLDGSIYPMADGVYNLGRGGRGASGFDKVFANSAISTADGTMSVDLLNRTLKNSSEVSVINWSALTAGTAGQVLATDGAGNVNWVSADGGIRLISANTILTSADHTVVCDSTATFTIQLPAGPNGKIFIFPTKGNGGGHATLLPNGADTFDISVNPVIANGNAIIKIQYLDGVWYQI